MIKVIGVKFRHASRIYYFDPTDVEFKCGDGVIVETVRGEEMGTVVVADKMIADDEFGQPIKPIIRKATDIDILKAQQNREKEPEAFKKCKEKIAEHGLEMKLVEAEYTYNGNKLIFYFTADGRIDFRELVKDLAAIFRTRIELRQIGVRDEAMIKGGIGICGRPLCCNTFLNDFAAVSIKMAKEQNLSLNPTKISGVCGRLMCCLKNEEETYEYLNSTLPKVGDEVIDKFEGIKGTVQSVNVLRQRVKVLVKVDEDNSELKEYGVDEINFKRREKKQAEPEEELDAELVALEISEKKDEEIKKENSGERQERRKDNNDNRHENHQNHRHNNHNNHNNHQHKERNDNQNNREEKSNEQSNGDGDKKQKHFHKKHHHNHHKNFKKEEQK